jgi:hypothetical protein
MACPNNDGLYDIKIDQGATFWRILTLKYANGAPINITGWSADMQIRRDYCTNTVSESLSTANGEIMIYNGPAGKMTLWLPPERTAALGGNCSPSTNGSANSAWMVLAPPLRPGEVPNTKYVYDLETIRTDGYTTRTLHGQVIVYREVTR